MAADGWTERIPVGQWSRENVLLATMFTLPAMAVIAIAASSKLQLATGAFAALSLYPLLAVVGLSAALWLYLHRGDYLEFDADGLTFVSRGRRDRTTWHAINEAWFGHSARGAIRLRAGQRRYTIPVGRLADNVRGAERLWECLAPIREAKRQAMAAGTVQIPPPTINVWGSCGSFAIGIAFVVHATFEPTRTGQVIFGGFGAFLSLAAPFLWLHNRYSVGPQHLEILGTKINLAEVDAVRIVRVGGREIWQLRAGRRKLALHDCPDFPMLCDHVVRRCAHAHFTYAVDGPRTTLEQVFMPRPPNGPESMGLPVEPPVVEAGQRRRETLAMLGMGLVFGAITVWLALTPGLAPLAFLSGALAAVCLISGLMNWRRECAGTVAARPPGSGS